jgi:DNA-binding response OmpR family regulator
MTQAANSALQSARLRFVEGLPARAEELSTTAERLARDPGDQEAAAMLRRRLHALLASAQVFEERALSLAVQDLIARLDIAQRAERAFTTEEVDAVTLVVASLPTYVRPSLQPPAAYSDVRELLGGVHERPTIRPAAVSGEAQQSRSEAATEESDAVVPATAPVLLVDPERDDYLPAALATSAPAVANDLAGGSSTEQGERPLPPRARRIVALSGLQPGNAPISPPASVVRIAAAPEPAPAKTFTPTASDTDDVPSMRPLPTQRESVPGPEVPLFSDHRSELQAEVEADAISEIVRTLAEPPVVDAGAGAAKDSWSEAVAEASDELAAWRDSLRPDPIADIDIEDESSGEIDIDTALESDDDSDSVPTTRVSLALTNVGGTNIPSYLPIEPRPSAVPDRIFSSTPSFLDVIAEAGRAGLGGGASALDTVDVGAAKASESLELRESALESSESPTWLESNRVAATGPNSVAPDAEGDFVTIESNRVESPATSVTSGLEAMSPEVITLDMRPPDVAAWTASRAARLARLAIPTADKPDADGDSSATIDVSPRSDEPAGLQLTAAGLAADSDADADSSATASIAAPPAYDGHLALPPMAATAADAGADYVELDFSDETSPGLGPPVLLKQTVSGLLPTPRPVLLLLVADAACAARVRANLTVEQFTIFHAETADDAVRRLHEAKPDLVLVSADLASLPDVDLVRRLKTDPIAPVQHVQVLLPEGASCDQEFLDQASADGAVNEPLTATALEVALRKSVPSPAEKPVAREGSIDEIAAQIAEEIRRGIAESLRLGKHDQMRVGDGSQLMAAAWSAIGRVRSHLADQSRSPSDTESQSSSLLPPPDTLPEDARTPSVHPSQLLAGCRVLVADDDPAVLWFFVGLLREASAHVLQAHNGREALELARRKQPHVIVSDILMPKLDGFGLCRELKRDALLSHVPVILLSWKDDLLQRMRELDAGAAGYLRKEAGSQQILAQLTDVLQPRTLLIAKLRGHAEVSGSLAELGALSMLELVAAERPDAQIVVRDAWNLFEVDIRGGRRLSVTRTAADGAFTRGEKGLMQLLGLAGGDFQVSSSTAALTAPIPEPLDRALSSAGRRLSALLDAVSDARLLRVCLIAFDDDVLQSLLSAPSTRLHEVVALFRTGLGTAEAVLREGRFAPGELEDYLRELARCVAITGVWDASGEDLVAAAQRERETPQLALLSSTLPPRTGSGSWSLAPEVRRRVTTSEPAATETQSNAAAPDETVETVEAASVAPASSSPEPQPRPSVPPPLEPALAALASSLPEPEPEPRPSVPPPLKPASEVASLARSDSEMLPAALPPSAAGANSDTHPGLAPSSQPPELPDWLKPRVRETATSLRPSSAELAVIAAGMTLSTAPTAAPAPFEERETDAVSKAELESFDLPVPSTFARAIPDRADGLRLAGTLLVLAGVGYFGWQQFILQPEQAQPAQTRIEAAQSPPPANAPTPAPAPAPKATPQPAQPTIQNTQFGKVLPFVDTSHGVVVAPDQGLLVIEFHGGAEPAPNIRVGARELGKPPLAIALPAGRHELVVRSGKSTSFRYLIVRAGETRIVSVPLAEL